MKGVEYFMKLPDQLKDIVYRLLQEPTLDNFRNFLKGQTGEHNSIDFKEKWIEPTKLVKEMLAIANSGGGIMIFGVKEKEDKSFSYDGIEEIVDKAKISNDIKNYISTELKYEVYDFVYDSSEYEKLQNHKYQMMVIKDCPRFIPFMSMKESTNLKKNRIYIRRGTSCEEATSEEITDIIKRRMNAEYPDSGKTLNLDEHLEQLKTLYSKISPTNQDNINTLNKELVDAKISLDEIYLDPNNPRFTSLKWDDIPDQQISDASIQAATKRKLEEEFSIYKLVDNIQINGFLPIDRVIVKKFAENKYVVLEGNRRICAAKNIMELYKGNPEQVEESVVDSLKEISCLIYTGSERQPSWVFQGLRHIIGIQEWPAYNKARLLVQLMEDENLSLTEVGKKFGLTAYGAGQWVRGYYAFIQAAEESDYTQEIDERAYPYLQEIFSRSNPVFKDWLQWNDTEYKFEDNLKFNEFLSWLYPRNEENVLDGVEVKGNWDNRLIKRSNDIRIVSFLLRESISDFEMFRADGDLEKAQNSANTRKYLESQDPSTETLEKIKSCTKALDDIPFKLVMLRKEELSDLLEKLSDKVGEILDACR